MEPISTTIIGEAIAIGAGLFIDSRGTTKQVKRAREFLVSGIKDDLKHSVEVSHTIKTEWEQNERVERSTLNKLKACALTYRHNLELIPMIYEHERGEHIFKYFHEIIEIVAEMEHDQGCINDVEAAFNDKLHSLKRHDPNISDEEAVDRIISVLTEEQKHYYSGLRRNMSASIERLITLTQSASTLDQTLQ